MQKNIKKLQKYFFLSKIFCNFAPSNHKTTKNMKAQSKLSNPEAYRFINVVMLPLVKKVCDELNVKYPKSSASKTSNDFKDINLTLSISGTSVQTSPTIYYSGNEYIGIFITRIINGW